MNALSINIPANFAADCNNTLKRYNAERRDGAGRKPCLFCQFDPGEPALGEQCPQNQAAFFSFTVRRLDFFIVVIPFRPHCLHLFRISK